jgi:hypothetical protein
VCNVDPSLQRLLWAGQLSRGTDQARSFRAEKLTEAFWPTATVRRGGERLSTEVGALRRRIRQAAGDKDIQPVVNPGSRYHLDPNLVDIDVWRLSTPCPKPPPRPNRSPASRRTA